MNDGPDPAWGEPSALVVPVSRQVRCDIGFVVARVRLLKFLHLGFLHSACVSAYECALAVPRGSAASAQAPPLVVSIGEPESGNGAIALPLRWDADWGSGRPGQVLDAELAFSAVAGSTAVRFDGMFRLPGAHHGGRAGKELAQTRAAVCGAESLLTQVAEALIRDSEAEATRRPAWRWIRPDSPDGPDPRLAPHTLMRNEPRLGAPQSDDRQVRDPTQQPSEFDRGDRRPWRREVDRLQGELREVTWREVEHYRRWPRFRIA